MQFAHFTSSGAGVIISGAISIDPAAPPRFEVLESAQRILARCALSPVFSAAPTPYQPIEPHEQPRFDSFFAA
jgi:hypothetical protein